MSACVWWGNLTERDQLEDLGVDGNRMGGRGMDWSDSEQGKVMTRDSSNEISGSTRCGEFYGYLKNY